MWPVTFVGYKIILCSKRIFSSYEKPILFLFEIIIIIWIILFLSLLVILLLWSSSSRLLLLLLLLYHYYWHYHHHHSWNPGVLHKTWVVPKRVQNLLNVAVTKDCIPFWFFFKQGKKDKQNSYLEGQVTLR